MIATSTTRFHTLVPLNYVLRVAVCSCVLIFCITLPLRLDEAFISQWWVVFIPHYVNLLIWSVYTLDSFRRYRKTGIQDCLFITFNSFYHFIYFLSIVGLLLWMTFMIQKLDGHDDRSWSKVFLPVIVCSGIAMVCAISMFLISLLESSGRVPFRKRLKGTLASRTGYILGFSTTIFVFSLVLSHELDNNQRDVEVSFFLTFSVFWVVFALILVVIIYFGCTSCWRRIKAKISGDSNIENNGGDIMGLPMVLNAIQRKRSEMVGFPGHGTSQLYSHSHSHHPQADVTGTPSTSTDRPPSSASVGPGESPSPEQTMSGTESSPSQSMEGNPVRRRLVRAYSLRYGVRKAAAVTAEFSSPYILSASPGQQTIVQRKPASLVHGSAAEGEVDHPHLPSGPDADHDADHERDGGVDPPAGSVATSSPPAGQEMQFHQHHRTISDTSAEERAKNIRRQRKVMFWAVIVVWVPSMMFALFLAFRLENRNDWKWIEVFIPMIVMWSILLLWVLTNAGKKITFDAVDAVLFDGNLGWNLPSGQPGDASGLDGDGQIFMNYAGSKYLVDEGGGQGALFAESRVSSRDDDDESQEDGDEDGCGLSGIDPEAVEVESGSGEDDGDEYESDDGSDDDDVFQDPQSDMEGDETQSAKPTYYQKHDNGDEFV
eukprot:TRINITY_DN45405_c0_g2_i1.p1 TRINITY_DN45405_c0_g2~~TRINITY_DN45405_c0_g2_i1.p1  ORF type:complete len:658 (-),score=170.94 TRINITY_DN45405_c0_g2_i1:1721-3694(-)